MARHLWQAAAGGCISQPDPARFRQSGREHQDPRPQYLLKYAASGGCPRSGAEVGRVRQLGLSVIRRRQQRPEIYRAGLELLIGMLTKHLADDFMWQSTMLIFWALSG